MGCNNLGSSCVQSDRGRAWTPRRDFAVSKSLAQPITIGCVAFEKAGATPNHDPARASAARSNRSECTTSGGRQVRAGAPPGAGARRRAVAASLAPKAECRDVLIMVGGGLVATSGGALLTSWLPVRA